MSYLGYAWPSQCWPPVPCLPGRRAWSGLWCRCRARWGQAWRRSSQAPPPASETQSCYLQGSQRGLYLNTEGRTKKQIGIIPARSYSVWFSCKESNQITWNIGRVVFAGRKDGCTENAVFGVGMNAWCFLYSKIKAFLVTCILVRREFDGAE